MLVVINELPTNISKENPDIQISKMFPIIERVIFVSYSRNM